MVSKVPPVMTRKVFDNIWKDIQASRIKDRPGECNIVEEIGAIAKVLEEFAIDTQLSRASPAVREYIGAAREWYRDLAKDRIQDAIDRCSRDEVTFKDIVDLWSLLICYRLPVPDKIGQEVANALVNAIVESGKITNKPKAIDQITKAVWTAFCTFPRSITPPEDSQSPLGDQGKDEAGDEEGQGSGQGIAPDEEETGGDTGSEETETEQEEPGEKEPEKESKSEKEEEDLEPELPGGGALEEPEPESEGDRESSGSSNDDGEQCPRCGEAIDPDNKSCDSCGYQSEAELEPAMDTDAPGYFASALDQSHVGLSPEQLDELKQAIEAEREDISEVIGATEGSGPVIMQLAEPNDVLARKLLLDAETEANALGYIFNRWHRAHARYVRGTEDGKIDPKLLYRGGMHDNHVFRDRELSQKLDMALCILIDASGSVRSVWPIISGSVACFIGGMGQRPDVDLIVLSYSSPSSTIMIRRIWDPSRREFRIGFNPGGGTPTDIAFATCREVIFKRFSRRKDKLVIHISDAEVHDLDKCTEEILKTRQANIHVGLVQTPSALTAPDAARYYAPYLEHIDKSYGRNRVVINTWQELPSGVEELLRNMLARR